jgi:hypothetical protein
MHSTADSTALRSHVSSTSISVGIRSSIPRSVLTTAQNAAGSRYGFFLLTKPLCNNGPDQSFNHRPARGWFRSTRQVSQSTTWPPSIHRASLQENHGDRGGQVVVVVHGTLVPTMIKGAEKEVRTAVRPGNFARNNRQLYHVLRLLSRIQISFHMGKGGLKVLGACLPACLDEVSPATSLWVETNDCWILICPGCHFTIMCVCVL